MKNCQKIWLINWMITVVIRLVAAATVRSKENSRGREKRTRATSSFARLPACRKGAPAAIVRTGQVRWPLAPAGRSLTTYTATAAIAPIAATAIAAIAAAIAAISAAAVANAAASAHPPSSSLSFFLLPWECFLQFSGPRPVLSGKPVLLNRRDGSKREHQI